MNEELIEKNLKNWHNEVAEIWDYSTSHCILRIQLRRKDNTEYAALMLHDCFRVEFDVAWRDIDIDVKPHIGDFGRRFYVTDGKRLFVDCGMIYFHEGLCMGFQ